MTSDTTKRVLNTFSARSAGYDNESSWVSDLDLITPLLGEPTGSGRMLDLCSGTCKVALYGKAVGWKAIACDLSLEMLRRCPDSDLPRLVCDAIILPFANSSFELVTMRQALHYLNLGSALREMKRVSSNKVTLGHITLEREEDEPIWREYFSIASPGRVHIFQPGHVASLLEKHGMKVIREEVLHTSDDFCGPVAHLATTQIYRLTQWIESVPKWFRERYKITPSTNMSYQYSHRWEFVTALV
jgi:hypothetical protein